VLGVKSSKVLAIEAHPYWNEFQALESCGMRSKLVSSERRQGYLSDACGPLVPSYCPLTAPLECEISISQVLAGATEAYL